MNTSGHRRKLGNNTGGRGGGAKSIMRVRKSNSVTKKKNLFLGGKNIGESFAPPPFQGYAYASRLLSVSIKSSLLVKL